MERIHPTRRSFLRTSALSGLAALSYSHVLGANERLRVGCIGVGQRGRNRLRSAQDHGAEIVAICDVNQLMLREAAALVRGSRPKESPYHEEVLARPDIDAVIVASADHWHRDHLIDAVAAGKDTYIEKPLTRTIEEGQEVVQAVSKSDRIVQVGNQRRSGKHWEKARDIVAAGGIGELRFVRTWDTRYRPIDPYVQRAKKFKAKEIDWERFLGRAPSRPFDPVRCSAWRWFWDFGGGLMTDIGPHRLDVAHWISSSEGPRSVVCNGGNYHSPEWETPDNVHAILDCGTFCINFNVHFMNGYDSGGAGYYGTGGTIFQQHAKMIHADTKGNVVEEWETPGEGELHMQNFLECVKSRRAPNSLVEVANKVIIGAHLGNISYRTGRRVHWDVDQERIL